MRALLTHLCGDLRRRWIQALIVALIVSLAAGVGTVAVLLLTQSSSPYGAAFQRYNGAHLVVYFNSSRESNVDLQATTRLPEVTASSGPWPVKQLPLVFGTEKSIVVLEGRSSPGGSVDRLAIVAGRWFAGPGEIV